MESTEQKTFTEDEWLDLLAEWEQSGEIGAAWCRKKNISYHRFGYWKRRLLGNPEKKAENQEFIEISPAASSSLKLEVNGVSIEITEGFSSSLLQETVRSLKQL